MDALLLWLQACHSHASTVWFCKKRGVRCILKESIDFFFSMMTGVTPNQVASCREVADEPQLGIAIARMGALP